MHNHAHTHTDVRARAAHTRSAAQVEAKAERAAVDVLRTAVDDFLVSDQARRP